MSTPFDGELFTFTNADGSEITLRGYGNANWAVFEDLAGYTVCHNSETGDYHYATQSDDETALVPTDAVVGRDDPSTLALSPGLRPRREATVALAASSDHLPEDTRRWQVRRRERQAALQAWDEGLVLAPPSRETTGTYVDLCLLIDFPDVAGTISTAEVTNFCNQVGYSGYGNNGSVRDYFSDVSDGNLTYTNVVTYYYTAQHNRSYYTDPSVAFGSRARELITEALDALVASGFDFDPLTADGANYIYALNAFYAGPTVNNWSEGLWPHQWGLASPYPVGGGKRFNDYQITSMGSALTLRTFCHENGHMICDFPDLYDYGGESYGPGHFCLMGYGGSNTNPTEVGAYLKHAAGWTSSIAEIGVGTTGAVTAGSNDFYRYAKNGTEYFLVENRQKTGRDTALPDAGLAIWHVDELGSNNDEQMTPSQHYECSLIQADNRFDLENRANAGDADDLFGAPGQTEFSDATSPDAKWWDGSNSGLIIESVSAPGPTMTFSGGGDAAAAVPVLAGPYRLLLG